MELHREGLRLQPAQQACFTCISQQIHFFLWSQQRTTTTTTYFSEQQVDFQDELQTKSVLVFIAGMVELVYDRRLDTS